MPGTVFAVGCMSGVEHFNWLTILNVVVVAAGMAVASFGERGSAVAALSVCIVSLTSSEMLLCLQHCFYPTGEVEFNLVGVCYQLGCVFSESVRLVLVQLLLQARFTGRPCSAVWRLPW